MMYPLVVIAGFPVTIENVWPLWVILVFTTLSAGGSFWYLLKKRARKQNTDRRSLFMVLGLISVVLGLGAAMMLRLMTQARVFFWHW